MKKTPAEHLRMCLRLRATTGACAMFFLAGSIGFAVLAWRGDRSQWFVAGIWLGLAVMQAMMAVRNHHSVMLWRDLIRDQARPGPSLPHKLIAELDQEQARQLHAWLGERLADHDNLPTKH